MADSDENDSRDAIAALVTRFYALFSNVDGRRPDLAEIHDLFIPEGLIVKAVGAVPEVYNLVGFIEPRMQLLTDGSLIDFSEWETKSRTDIFGNVGLRVSHYSKRGSVANKPFEAHGVNTMQFVRVCGVWKFACVSWFDY